MNGPKHNDRANTAEDCRCGRDAMTPAPAPGRAAIVALPAPTCVQFFASLPAHDWLRRWRGPSAAEGCDDSWVPLLGIVYDRLGDATCCWFPLGVRL